jgi:hypothetical protein
MRHLDSVCATPAGWVTREARTLADWPNATRLWCVTATVPGQYGHLSSGPVIWVPCCGVLDRSAMLIRQWCFPFFRQHAGRLDSEVPLRANSGVISVKLKSSSSEMEMSLRTVGISLILSVRSDTTGISLLVAVCHEPVHQIMV